MQFNFHVEDHEAQTIMDGLASLPYGRVFTLIAKLSVQFQAQAEAAQAAAKIPTTPKMNGRKAGKDEAQQEG